MTIEHTLVIPRMAVSSVGTKRETWLIRFGLLQTGLPAMPATYLETLNREQRRAVEHGGQTKYGAPGSALLVIAGAGSGKTNTVAHRVANRREFEVVILRD
jgi:hypothetical protein